MKVLVTGATGNVGRYVVESLVEMGELVVAAGTQLEKVKKAFGEIPSVTPTAFDFTDTSTFESALKDVDRVFLMRPPHLGKPEDLKPFVEELVKRKIKLVVFLSLMGIEKNPFPPHYKVEKLIEMYGLPYCHIRPGFFMQNLSGIHSEEIKNKNEIFVPAGRSRTSFIDAADIGHASALVLHRFMDHLDTAYTLTGPEALSYFEVAAIFSRVLGRSIRYQKPSVFRYRRLYISERGLDKAFVNVTVMLYLMTRLGTAKKVTPDFEKLTGRKPRTLEQFVRDNRDAFVK